ncbi:MAG: hypothetical protein HC916_09860 [Coleofasciculaceae cyanobacterium SM2_1_6]|nr:hypothetical protein [Coleofasciculaceae cyanobacterium SM2_1_6]
MSQIIEKISNFAQAIELIETLSLQEQEALIEIMEKQIALKRRSEIAASISEAHDEYKSGQARLMTVDELMAEAIE